MRNSQIAAGTQTSAAPIAGSMDRKVITTPQQGSFNSQRPEGDAADCALEHRNDDIAFDRGAYNRGELVDELARIVVSQWYRMPDRSAECGAVSEQEEEEIEHDAEADEELQRVLTQAEDAAGNGLAGLHEACGYPFAQLGEAAEPQRTEPVVHKSRHRLLDAGEICVEVYLVAADPLVEAGSFLDEGPEDDHRRQDDEADAQEDR